MDKSVSIIAPAYNHVKYIESCLRSIANQKCEDMELIVLDDCSKDGTQNVIRQIIAEESFQKSFSMGIRFISHSENKGAHDTINEGLMMAKGKYLAVINTDDAFGENHLAGLLDACEREGSEFAFGGVRVVDENDRPVTNGFAKAIMKYQDTARMCPTATMALTRGNCTISTGNMVFTSRLYCKLEGFRNYKYVHDWDFALRAALITEPVFVPDAYYIYRLHIGNTIGELANNLEDTCKMADGIDQVGPNPLVEFLKKILLGQYTNKSIPSREVWEYFFTQKKYFADDHDGEYAWNEAKKLQNENNTFSKMKDELFSEKDRQLENVREQLREKEEELLNLQDKYDDLQRMYNKVQFNYDEISNAFFWKATGPLRRALDKGKNRFRRNIYARRIWHTLKWICYKGKVPGSYNLWPAEANLIYDPNDPMTILCTKHTWFISQLIQNSLKKAGIEADILIDEPAEYSKRLHIVVCPQMFRRLPSKYISFQMEQTISSRWLNKTYLNILENSYAVFDYSLKNIEYFRKTVDFSRMFYYLPVDYLPGIRREKDDYEYDVVFYGDPNSGRRQVILKQLEEHFNIKIISEVFGEELYSELSKAKVVVNIHYYENAMLETTRLYETLSLGKSVVVSERSSDPKEDERLQGIVDFVPVDNLGLMIDKISWWLSHEEERRAAVERNNDTFAHHSSAFDYYFLRFLLANDWLSFDEFYRLAGDFVNFDKNHICVSLPESTERGRAFRDEIRDKNIEFQLFPALRHRRGWTGCGLSYKFIMKKAQEQNMDSILICEDDVFLPDDFDYRWALCEAYLNKSDDWDIFQGMMSDIGDVNISAVHKELGQTFVHMDHMISAVFNYYRKNIFERVVSWDEKNDDVDSNTFDRVLESQELRVVCTDPFLVGHKDDLYSDIWGFRNYQYKSLIEDSSKKLNKLVKEFETGGLSDYGFTYTSNSENRKKQDDA